MIYVILSILTACIYVSIQLIFSNTWRRLKSFEDKNSKPITSRLAILVPVRNEAESIERCIEALLAQDYPASLLEIWVLDNHSSDQTVETVSQWVDDRLKVIQLADYLKENQTFKKEALTFGIDQTNCDWILTTDGDCVPPSKWASTMVQYALQKELDMVMGSVKMETQDSFIENYQALDTAGLMAISAAGLKSNLLISGNGANFLFRKSVFVNMGGYRDNQKHRSGDDLFLLQNFQKCAPNKVGHVKNMDATVLTFPESSWRAFFAQRLRWVSKSQYLPHRSTRYISVLVFLNSFLLLAHLLLIPIFGELMVVLFLIHFALKAAVDTFLLYHATSFFGLTFPARDWCMSTLLNPLYIVLVGSASMIGKKPIWKNRRI